MPLYVREFNNTHLPLKGVCLKLSKTTRGACIFAGISLFCLAFVIFATSAQSLSGLRAACCCCSGKALVGSRRRISVRNPSPVSRDNLAVPIKERDNTADRIKGQCCLFFLFAIATFGIILAFAYIPFYRAEPLKRGMVRDDALWREACTKYDTIELRRLGLS